MTLMVVAVTGFGSVWRRRFGRSLNDPKRFARTAYYNTTGVPVDGTVRTRPKIVGHARFNAAGGFNPNYPQRMIDKVFGCDEPCVWQGQNKVFFRRLLPAARKPDCFLVVVRRSEIGRLDIGNPRWKSGESLLVSFSECHEEQEGMLLMAAHGWVRSEVGTFFLQPLVTRPWVARLRFTLTPALPD